MRKLKLALLAAAAIVPFGWNGATAGAVADVSDDAVGSYLDPAAAETLGVTGKQAESGKPSTVETFNCCYVFVWGRWWCVPCG